MESRWPIKVPPKGRGAVTNRSGRFEALAVEAVDDGWDLDEGGDDEDLPPLRTQVTFETPRTIKRAAQVRLLYSLKHDAKFRGELREVLGIEEGP